VSTGTASVVSSGGPLVLAGCHLAVAAALVPGRLWGRAKARWLEREDALLRAAEAVAGELERERLLQRVVEQAAALLRAEAADCYLLDRARGVLRCAAVHGLDPALVGRAVEAAAGAAGAAVERGRPVPAAAYAEVAGRVPHAAYRGFRRALVAPLAWGGEVRGVLAAGTRDAGRSFDRADLELLEAFAGVAALALRNAELLAERTRQARAARAFAQVSALLAEPLSPGETFAAAARAAAGALAGDFAAVVGEGAAGPGVLGGYALPPAVRELGPPRALVEALVASPVVAVRRARDDGRLDPVWRRGPFASLLAIRVEEGRSAVVVFFRAERAFGAEELELARHVARATSAALERSRAFESERAARSLSQRLAAAAGALAAARDPTAVLDAAAEQARLLVGADTASVATLARGELVVGAAAGAGGDALVGARCPPTGSAAGDVVQLRAPVVLEDAGDDRPAEPDPVLAAGQRAYVGVPLAAPGGEPHGVLAVSCAAPRRWREEEVEALAALAAHASVALAGAELYQRLALEHEQNAAILSNVADGIVAVGRDGRVVVWNAAAERITGVPATEALGHPPSEVLRRELESERGGANRLVAIARGGEEVWLSLSETVMRDPAGAVAGRIFAFRDISAERIVDRMKSDFVSTVSQELRRPLTSIYGFAATLLRRDIGFSAEERETFLGYIASESERLTEIVDALLDVARLESGTLELELVPTDVGEVLREAASDEGAPALANGHRFAVEIEDDVPPVRADPAKLRQVVGRLVENAVKFSPAGSLVRLEARARPDAVEITVADEGSGIPEAQLERIFAKFWRGSDTAPGTGLGLFIAQGLVSAMGGTIRVASAEGAGSRFTFALPVADGSRRS
jgi:PAS domain S-box-containing protein